MGFFVSIRILVMIIAPAIISLFEILRIMFIKKKNGNVIYKQGEIEKQLIIVITIITIIFISMALLTHNMNSLLIYLLLYWIGTIGYFEVVLTNLFKGIYDNVIVYSGYTCDWEDIEKVIFLENKIRFIHKEKGAFDFDILENNYSKVKDIIQKKIPNYI